MARLTGQVAKNEHHIRLRIGQVPQGLRCVVRLACKTRKAMMPTGSKGCEM